MDAETKNELSKLNKNIVELNGHLNRLVQLQKETIHVLRCATQIREFLPEEKRFIERARKDIH